MPPFFASLLRPELAEIAPYTPHPGSFPIRLDANEAPPFLSREARARLAEAAANTALERYPDASASALRAALAARSGVIPDEVLVGVGSDELITLLLTAFARPRARAEGSVVLTTTPTFVMYRLSAQVRGQRVLEIPLDEHWDLCEPDLRRALAVGEPSLIFLASPNNPTGNRMTSERLRAIIEAAQHSLVVIDEAYIDYSDGDQLELYRKHENVAVLRTLSKIGFAALRVGWLIARPELVRELDKVRLPYNLPSLSQGLATLAVSELAGEIQGGIQRVIAERQRVTERLSRVPGVSVTPSQANFLWVQSETPAKRLFEGLLARGILVRCFHARGGRLQHCFRVTIGTPEENDAFLEALLQLF